jgi:hypothetical protein
MKELLEERITVGVHDKVMPFTLSFILHVKSAAFKKLTAYIVPSCIVASRDHITRIRRFPCAANARHPRLIDRHPWVTGASICNDFRR